MTYIGLNAHLLASAANYRRAGIHGYIYHLLAHLPSAAPDWQFKVFVGKGEPPSNAHHTLQRSSINTESPLRRIFWEQFVQPFQLGGLDLVHQLAFVAPVADILLPRPFVVTIYDLSFIRYPERLPTSRRLYLNLMTRLACRRARRVMAISRSTAEDLVSLLGVPRAKIDLAIPGVEARFTPLPTDQVEAWRAQKGLPKRFFLFVGTLEPRKNLMTLVRAYADLPQPLRQTTHLILGGGKGWMTDDLPKTIESLGIHNTVHLPGYLPDEELIWWYNCAVALVFPSVFEGWGLPVTEAMACGVPPIVSNVSSLPEAANGAGITLPPDDIGAWTHALARAATDLDWRERQSKNALEQVKQFTWAQTAQQTVNSYRKALGL